MVPPCFVSEQTIGGFGISTADPAVETVFVDTGRIFVNDYLRVRISLEQRFLNQGFTNRTMLETLDIGWELLRLLPEALAL